MAQMFYKNLYTEKRYDNAKIGKDEKRLEYPTTVEKILENRSHFTFCFFINFKF
jgi:hypothetical protein